MRVRIFFLLILLAVSPAADAFEVRLEKETLEPGDRLACLVTDIRGRKPIVVRVVDAHGRTVAGRVYEPRDRDRLLFETDMNAFSTPMMTVQVAVGKEVKSAPFRMTHTAWPWTRYRPIIDMAEAPDDAATYRMLKSLGVYTATARSSKDIGALLKHGMAAVPIDLIDARTNIALGGEAWQTILTQQKEAAEAGKEFTPARPVSLYNPKLRESGVEVLRNVAERLGFAQPPAYLIATDLSTTRWIHPVDFTYSDEALAAFRAFLDDRYNTVGRLNRAWGTDFDRIDEVVPLTTDAVRQREFASSDTPGRRDEGLNFTPWNDRLEFDDRTLADLAGTFAGALRSQDPEAIAGSRSLVVPAPYGGHDFWLLSDRFDIFLPADVGLSQELIGSFLRQRGKPAPLIGLAPKPDAAFEAVLWRRFFNGHRGVVVPGGFPLKNEEGKLSREAKRLQGFVDAVTSGFDTLLTSGAMAPEPERVALVHSRKSLRAQWMLDTRALGRTWFAQDPAEYIEGSTYIQNLVAWTELLKDAGIPYRFVPPEVLTDRDIRLNETFDVIVLPKTLALSERQARRIERFAERGGVVIADSGTGRFDESLTEVERRPLDRFFGIERERTQPLEVAAQLNPNVTLLLEPAPRAPDREPYDLLKNIDVGVLRLVEPQLETRGGSKNLLRSGRDHAAFIVKKQRRGVSVYMNVSIVNYLETRKTLGAGDQTPIVVGRTMALGKVAPLPQPVPANGGVLAHVEQRRWQSRYAQAIVYMGRHGSGTDAALVEGFERKPVTLTLSAGFKHVYDVFARKYLGEGPTVETVFGYDRPLVLARLPYRVTEVMVAKPTLEARRRIGLDFELRAVDGPARALANHVVNLRLFAPDGKERRIYRTNLVVAGGRYRGEFQMALSDPPGTWRIELLDLLTGEVGKEEFELPKIER